VDAGTKALSSDRLNAPGAPGDFGARRFRLAARPRQRGARRRRRLPGAPLEIGAQVRIVPNHVCPVVNRSFDEVAARSPAAASRSAAGVSPRAGSAASGPAASASSASRCVSASSSKRSEYTL
jgi:hypothetical protein